MSHSDDSDRFASIHSNPPAQAGNFVALAINQFGKGRCIYLNSSLLAIRHHAQQSFGEELLKKYVNSDIKIITNIPSCVEITILKSKVQKKLLIYCVNFQDELPNIVLNDLKAELSLPPTMSPMNCEQVIGDAVVELQPHLNAVVISIKRLETILAIEISFGKSLESK